MLLVSSRVDGGKDVRLSKYSVISLYTHDVGYTVLIHAQTQTAEIWSTANHNPALHIAYSLGI